MNQDAILLEASSEMLFLLDAQSLIIMSASDGAHAQLGYAKGSLIGMPISDIECALSDHFFWEEITTSETPLETQGSYRRFDGSEFDVRKFAKRSGPLGTFYSLRVRPARGPQRPEMVLSDIGLHLAATLEATEDCILLTNTDCAILNMNRRFSEFWSLPQHLLIERDDHGIVAWIDHLLQTDEYGQPTTLHQVVEFLAAPAGDTFEMLYLKDGRVMECFSHPARSLDKTIGRVFCFREVTERKQHEASLKEARDKAQHAMTSKSQFLANMSHEIRTPMNAIMGMLRLLQGTDLNARQLDYVCKAEGAAHSLLGLLNDILDFSKMDAGKMTLDPQPFKLERLLRDISVIFAANLGHKPVDILFDIDPAIPQYLIGDVLRMQQVLINLGTNAIKFKHLGAVVIHMVLVHQIGDDATLRISVRDSGIGIATEHQKSIFEDFSQAEASTTRRFGGTGLGLSICKRLVALMGGTLQCESTLGQGSTFYFVITLKSTSQPDHEPDINRLSESLKVLLVDDNHVARGLLCNMVQSLGWQVDAAASGQQAIDRVKESIANAEAPYQVVIMDWEMPIMDGWKTIAHIRRTISSAGASMPIMVMVTAHDRNALALRSASEQSSLNVYLVKPITTAMMHDAVATALAHHSELRTRPRLTGEHQPGRLQGMRLLVVEDNLINQQVAKELLTQEGAWVELAENGMLGVAAVLQASEKIPFDAVLMDIQMPVMDGFAATKAIRAELGFSQLPIIAMTANAMASDREDCLAAGMNDHVGKPFDLGHLVKLLLDLTHAKVETKILPALTTTML
jgi:signal transduction histidine kinase/DNA-binding response OmpR family regulator